MVYKGLCTHWKTKTEGKQILAEFSYRINDLQQNVLTKMCIKLVCTTNVISHNI